MPDQDDANHGHRVTNVLVVLANPARTAPLRLGEEDRVIKEALRLGPRRHGVRVELLHAASVHDLRTELLRRPYEVVHIAAHGSPEHILFESEGGGAAPVPAAALAEQFAAYVPPRGALRCVILNACDSLDPGTLISSGVPYVIAMDGPLTDDAAVEFSRGFYDALIAGHDIELAFDEGRRCARLAAPGGRIAPHLLRWSGAPPAAPAEAPGRAASRVELSELSALEHRLLARALLRPVPTSAKGSAPVLQVDTPRGVITLSVEAWAAGDAAILRGVGHALEMMEALEDRIRFLEAQQMGPAGLGFDFGREIRSRRAQLAEEQGSLRQTLAQLVKGMTHRPS